MEQSILLKIEDSVKKYASVISSVLNVDVDIADQSLIRVAGTGRFLRDLRKPIDNEGNAFKRVLQTKESLFIENPKIHEICIGCPNLGVCADQCEICCPIVLKDQVIGVISLGSSDEQQKKRILENVSNYIAFLENIADLIATKAFEYATYQEQTLMLEILQKLVNLINDGVIIFGADNNILYMNRKTELLLGHNLYQLKYLHKIRQFSIEKINNKNNIHDVEYIARINDKKVRLLGSLYPINVGVKEISRIFIFQDIVSLHQNLIQSNRTEVFDFNNLVGNSDIFIKAKEQGAMFSCNDANILIFGETGTGKEMFARAIHNESMRKSKPFIKVTCDGTTDSIFEKEIFGDSLQSSEERMIGKIDLSNGGTLFIDKISALPLRLQDRLMSIIQNQREVNCRIIAATSKDLKKLVEYGEFREDLYYTLEAFTITIPPLRTRKKDIVLLANHFLKRYGYIEGKEVILGDDVYNIFVKYSWPGNVREMEKIISFIVSTHNSGQIASINDLPNSIQNKLIENKVGQYNLQKIEKEIIVKALNAFGNSTEAKRLVAKELGISNATLYRKLKEYSIVEAIYYDSQNEN